VSVTSVHNHRQQMEPGMSAALVGTATSTPVVMPMDRR
jgi:hypothetical protein